MPKPAADKRVAARDVRSNRHVALVIETSSVYGRNLLSGVVRYMRMHGDWSVFLEQRDLWQQPPVWLESWRGDGIISRATTPRLQAMVERTGVPFIEVTDRFAETNLPQVRSDDAAIGRMAAEHLLERGFTRFAYCGFQDEAWSLRREQAFAEYIHDKTGMASAHYNSVWQGVDARAWEDEQAALMQWLSTLKPPFAVMACNDVRGQHVIDACTKLHLAVPEQVAVIGVDDDELLCRLCSPPLSSVVPGAAMVGFRAAELLASLMNSKPSKIKLTPRDPLLIQPLGVATRQSTDVVAIDDRHVAAALHFIRQHACRGITVNDVVKHSGLSRSTLERQVRKLFGRTPQEEIRHVQVKQVQELLLTTDLTAEQIAGLCGFEHSEYMHVVFKRLTGLTTGQFRMQANP